MFEARLAEAKILKHSIEAVSQLITEATFSLGNDGIDLLAMDPANVSLIKLHLDKKAFESYKLDTPQKIGINMEDLTSILKRAKADQPIALFLSDDSRLSIRLPNRKFDIPLLELGERKTKTPTLDFHTSVQLKAGAMDDAISDAEVIGDAITLEADKNQLSARAEGDGRKVDIEFEKDSILKITSNGDNKIRSMFPLDYLKKMAKASKLSDIATLHLGADYPLQLDYEDDDKKFSLSFVLAPRIEND